MHKRAAALISKMGIAVALAMLACLALAFAAQADEDASSAMREPEVMAWQGQEKLKALPLDAIGNPYAAQYTALDRLLRQHVWAVGEELPSEPTPGHPGERAQTGYRWQYLQLDHAGWQLPLAETWRQEELARQLDDRRDGRGQAELSRLQILVAVVPETSDVILQMHSGPEAARATIQPHVPDWLALSTPAAITPLPDGSFITEGSPGSWWRDYGGNMHVVMSPQARHNEWLRYSAAGELLGACPLHGGYLGWLEITAPQLGAVAAAARAAGRDVQFVDGFMLVYSNLPYGEVVPETGIMGKLPDEPQLVAAYDWDGIALDISQPLTRAGGYCIPLAPDFP